MRPFMRIAVTLETPTWVELLQPEEVTATAAAKTIETTVAFLLILLANIDVSCRKGANGQDEQVPCELCVSARRVCDPLMP